MGFGIYSLFCGFEAVLQTDGTVEDQMVSGRILGVRAEITQTHELEGGRCLGILQTGFYLTTGENLQRVGVQTGKEILTCGIGVGIVEEIVVLTNFRVTAGCGIYPMNGSALDLPAVGRIAASGIRIVGCQNFGDIAVFVSDTACALDDISAF